MGRGAKEAPNEDGHETVGAGQLKMRTGQLNSVSEWESMEERV